MEVCNKFAPLFLENVREVVEGSGRCSGKSTANEVAAVAYMMASKYNNVWYCRAAKETIRSTIFSSMISTIQMMGLSSCFKWTLAPLMIICTKTGAVCYFSGINGKTDDDLTATKGFTPAHKTLQLCILDEADQTKHPDHITAWVSTAARFLRNNAKIIFAYNPPMSRNHWAYRFFNDRIRAGAVNVYTTWEDIKGQLSDRVVSDILRFRENDPEYYRFWYLGEPVNMKGLVYPQFNRTKHVINIWEYFAQNPRDGVAELILGLDEGTVNDSTCVTPLAILRSGAAIVMDCLEIDPLVDGQRSPAETARELWQYLSRLFTAFPFLASVPRSWIFESAEGGRMLGLQFAETFGEDIAYVTHKSVMGDIKRVRSMLSEGLLLFNKTEGSEVLMQDIENYIFDPRTGDVKKQQRDDTIDSLEYATKKYYNTAM